MIKKIKVHFIDPTDKDLDKTLGFDVCLHLSRHNIKANAQFLSTSTLLPQSCC
jgi:hypothetical protein